MKGSRQQVDTHSATMVIPGELGLVGSTPGTYTKMMAIFLENIMRHIYIYVWVNYNISLTRIKAILG